MMNTKNITPDELPDNDGKISSEEVENLRKQMYELQMEVDILKETINVLKKRPRRRLESLEEQGKGSGNRRHEGDVSTAGSTPEDGNVQE